MPYYKSTTQPGARTWHPSSSPGRVAAEHLRHGGPDLPHGLPAHVRPGVRAGAPLLHAGAFTAYRHIWQGVCLLTHLSVDFPHGLPAHVRPGVRAGACTALTQCLSVGPSLKP
jgi:hypothetical protein